MPKRRRPGKAPPPGRAGKAPPPERAHWGIITYVSASARGPGYFLDSFVAGTRDDADLEVAAARAAPAGGGAGYTHTFAAPLTRGFRRITQKPRAPADVWLYRRDANGVREYMVKAAAAGVAPPAEGPEWDAILVAEGWVCPRHAARAAPPD